MSEIDQTTHQVKKPKSIKNLSKLRLLQISGLLNRKFNFETLEFEKSWSIKATFFLALLSKFEIRNSKFEISFLLQAGHFNFLSEERRSPTLYWLCVRFPDGQSEGEWGQLKLKYHKDKRAKEKF